MTDEQKFRRAARVLKHIRDSLPYEEISIWGSSWSTTDDEASHQWTSTVSKDDDTADTAGTARGYSVYGKLDVAENESANEQPSARTAARAAMGVLQSMNRVAIDALMSTLTVASVGTDGLIARELRPLVDEVLKAGEQMHLLQPASDWERVSGIRILDPDGWRGDEDFLEAWQTPIDKQEWLYRVSISTVDYSKVRDSWAEELA